MAIADYSPAPSALHGSQRVSENKKVEKDQDSTDKVTYLFNKVHYLFPLPNGGFIESSIDLKEKGFKNSMRVRKMNGNFTRFCHIGNHSQIAFEENQKFQNIIQKIISSKIKEQETRTPPQFFYDIYEINRFFSSSKDKGEIFRSKNTLGIAASALFSALGINENDYDYQASSNLDEDDFLEILSEQNDPLEEIYQAIKKLEPAKKQSLTRLIHHALFITLNDKEPDIDACLGTIREEFSEAYTGIENTLKSIFDSLLVLKKEKAPEPKPEAKPKKKLTTTPTPKPTKYPVVIPTKTVPTQPAFKLIQKPKMERGVTHMCWCAAALCLVGSGISAVGFLSVAGIDIGVSISSQYTAAIAGLALLAIGIALACVAGIERHTQLSSSTWFKQHEGIKQGALSLTPPEKT